MLQVLKGVLLIQLQVSDKDILQKPYPGKEKLAKDLGCLGGWGWLPVNVIHVPAKVNVLWSL